MQIIKTKGIVIKEYTVGESDKFISIFTKSNGKIMVTAPYAKRYHKGFASGTQLFVYAEFVLQEYKGNKKLLQVEVLEMFHPLREDLLKLSYGAYILEFIDATMEENMYSPEVLRLIVRTLQALCKQAIKPPLIRYIFELKHMSINGFMPRLFECSECGISYEQCTALYFDVRRGGIACSNCSATDPYCYPISPSTLYTMQHIVNTHIDDLFLFTVSNEILLELRKIMNTYVSYYIDKQFQTLQFIEEMR